VKPQLILKSLADLPANVLPLAASMPGRAVNFSKEELGPTGRTTRGEIRAARRRSAQFADELYSRVNAPLQSIRPWQRGGLNE
jgi:hypothetical protein